MRQLKSASKRTINWNKYQLTVISEIQNQYLGFLINPSFQAVNRHNVLLLENGDDRKVNTKYYLQKEGKKDYNVMIDGKMFLISQ